MWPGFNKMTKVCTVVALVWHPRSSNLQRKALFSVLHRDISSNKRKYTSPLHMHRKHRLRYNCGQNTATQLLLFMLPHFSNSTQPKHLGFCSWPDWPDLQEKVARMQRLQLGPTAPTVKCGIRTLRPDEEEAFRKALKWKWNGRSSDQRQEEGDFLGKCNCFYLSLPPPPPKLWLPPCNGHEAQWAKSVFWPTWLLATCKRNTEFSVG